MVRQYFVEIEQVEHVWHHKLYHLDCLLAHHSHHCHYVEHNRYHSCFPMQLYFGRNTPVRFARRRRHRFLVQQRHAFVKVPENKLVYWIFDRFQLAAYLMMKYAVRWISLSIIRFHPGRSKSKGEKKLTTVLLINWIFCQKKKCFSGTMMISFRHSEKSRFITCFICSSIK